MRCSCCKWLDWQVHKRCHAYRTWTTSTTRVMIEIQWRKRKIWQMHSRKYPPSQTSTSPVPVQRRTPRWHNCYRVNNSSSDSSSSSSSNENMIDCQGQGMMKSVYTNTNTSTGGTRTRRRIRNLLMTPMSNRTKTPIVSYSVRLCRLGNDALTDCVRKINSFRHLVDHSSHSPHKSTPWRYLMPCNLLPYHIVKWNGIIMKVKVKKKKKKT